VVHAQAGSNGRCAFLFFLPMGREPKAARSALRTSHFAQLTRVDMDNESYFGLSRSSRHEETRIKSE